MSQANEPARRATSGDVSQPLSANERTTLAACEAVIAENLGAWVNVSNALIEINERRLYRERHRTFAEYMRERWGLSRSQGHRIVLHTRVLLSPIGDKIRNEAQSREIASLLDQPALLARVVERAEEIQRGGPLTAAALRQARLELSLPPEEAKRTRVLFDLSAWEDERRIAWEEWSIRYIDAFVETLPASEWAWAHAQLQTNRAKTSKAQRERFIGVLVKVAMDVPLTDNVVHFLREGTKAVGITVSELFTKNIDALGASGGDALRKLLDRLASANPEALAPVREQMLDERQEMVSATLRSLTDRMAEVVLATAAPRQLSQRSWSANEVAQSRAGWTQKTGSPWPDGELARLVKVTQLSLALTMRKVVELTERLVGLPSSPMPPRLADFEQAINEQTDEQVTP